MQPVCHRALAINNAGITVVVLVESAAADKRESAVL
jgi:hypothetical protein